MAIIPLIPWEPSVFPQSLQNELNRRKINRSFNFTPASDGDWAQENGEWTKYRGPMTSWVRFCSNGAGVLSDDSGIYEEYYNKPGFILFGGKDFYDSYGFLRPNEDISDINNESIIGYQPNGNPHVIYNDVKTSNYPIHVPPPEIERITVTIQKELYRRATIEWVCFSPKQLEYMTPYFLVPGISCVLEWGWNHYNSDSLIDLNNTAKLKELKKFPYPIYTDNILSSNGNYDVVFGIVTHFEWSIDGNRIRCKTEITSHDRLYAGIPINSTAVTKKNKYKVTEDEKEDNKDENLFDGFLDTLRQFNENSLSNIRSIATAKDPEEIGKDPEISTEKKKDDTKSNETQVNEIGNFVTYVKETYSVDKGYDANTWKEIIYGIFYGREIADKSATTLRDIIYPNKNKKQDEELEYANKEKDFDMPTSEATWINMGMLIEILNYHVRRYMGYSGNAMFRININDCVINGHPNMISSDGDICLIPNAVAPKYFYGQFGFAEKDVDQKKYKSTLSNSNSETDYPSKDSKKIMDFADKIMRRVCLPLNKIYRDDLNVTINKLRISKIQPTSGIPFSGTLRSFAFPFNHKQTSGIKGEYDNGYPEFYSGYLKDVYFNVQRFVDIVNGDGINTYADLIKRILKELSQASGGLWDLALVDGTGKSGDKEVATMKIIDGGFVSSVNSGKIYTFDYFDAESLLQSIKFSPTISSAQTIRTMYAATNNPKNKTTLRGQNQLLNYHFKDRLFLDEAQRDDIPRGGTTTTSGFKQKMTELQGLSAPPGATQMTIKDGNGKILVKRFVLPDSDVLDLLLDDDDIENNPRYTGIMPGIQAQFTIQGVGGLRTFMYFLVRNLPEPYSHENIVFRILDLTESLEGGKWTTSITAGILPLRDRIRARVGLKVKND